MDATLALEDGRIFRGQSFGALGERGGEVVFNTSMTGYQEILTDPSYRGQIVAMTCPEIGNYGVNDFDVESRRPQVEGFVVREISELHSNWRSRKDLPQYLKENDVVGISEVDTRALTRHLRSRGALRGIVSTLDHDAESLTKKAAAVRPIEEQNLVARVSTRSPHLWRPGADPLWTGERPRRRRSRFKVVAFDFGIKEHILRQLEAGGCKVTVVPWDTHADEIVGMGPSGLFLSNGPGDPAVLGRVVETMKRLIERVPTFGICLGHQILGLAYGAKTYKMKFGHHGANHPVMNMKSRAVEITSQNHGYAVDAASLPDAVEITHVSLNDGAVEGMRHKELPVFSVQYHPEASPGPHDARYLFRQFTELMSGTSGSAEEDVVESISSGDEGGPAR